MRFADGPKPTLSVIIPCFNQGRFLSAAIDSAFAQTDAALAVEVIVVNDGSTDETGAVAAGYGDRILYIEQANAGVSAARNRGALASSGEWLNFLDADDWLEPGFFATLLAEARRSPPPDCLYGSCRMCDEQGREMWLREAIPLPPGDAVHGWLARDYAVCHAMLIRREALAESGLWDTALKGAEDRDLWLRLAATGATFLAVPAACVAYRRYEASTTGHFETIFFSAKRVLARHMRHHGRCAACRKAYREGMRGMRKYCLDGNFWHTLKGNLQASGLRGALGFVAGACIHDPALIIPLARHTLARFFSRQRPERAAPANAPPVPGGAHS